MLKENGRLEPATKEELAEKEIWFYEKTDPGVIA